MFVFNNNKYDYFLFQFCGSRRLPQSYAGFTGINFAMATTSPLALPIINFVMATRYRNQFFYH
jgi:hypothetical protein